MVRNDPDDEIIKRNRSRRYYGCSKRLKNNINDMCWRKRQRLFTGKIIMRLNE
ncbi:hypothetical protein D083_4196 [Dickeya solani RNS 08.23.3.1.A]|nr:hypothetical protein D083_4196 [Dickeya solani RNS 08.23.3.1.A]